MPLHSAAVATADELRDAMRRFPTGIAVLTLVHEGRPLGVTVGSLVSVALEPPLVGVSIGHHSPVHTPLHEAGRFALNILAGDQEQLAQHFARGGIPPLALWTGVPVREDADGEPLLEGALAWLGCDVASEHAAGDHTFVVGSVRTVELGRNGPGLVYVDGSYRPA
jgi:flavin reductase (DIM6/NTAB) family NADH-FMN oxidoreductase RutF